MLVPGETPVRRAVPFSTEPGHHVEVDSSRIRVRYSGRRKTMAVLSMPAQQAAKCVRLQGDEAFWRFHLSLFRAYYDEGKNISEREVLIGLAAETGVDADQFTAEYDSGRQKNEVLSEHDDYEENWGGWGIPLAIIGDQYPVIGAVSPDIYRRAIDRFLYK